MCGVRDRRDEFLGFSLSLTLVPALFGPVLDDSPVDLQVGIRSGVGVSLRRQASGFDQFFDLMRIVIVDGFRLGREIVLVRQSSDASLEPALDGLSGQVISAVILPLGQ